MKCTQCNAPITLEDEFCPYCGALNRQARQHIEDMKRYGREFETTRTEVMTNVRRQGTRHAYMIGIAILILINAVFFAAHFATYDIADALDTLSVRRNSAAYEAQLQEYEHNGQYALLHDYYSKNYLYDGGDALRCYNSEADMAGDYSSAMDYIYYLANPQTVTYYTKNELVEYLAREISSFYETWSYKDTSYYESQFTEERTAAMEDMESRLQASLKTYLTLTDEDLAQLPEISRQDLMILLGKRVALYE